MSKEITIDKEEYKQAIKHILEALNFHAEKARTAKTADAQVAHANAVGQLSGAFHAMYPG
jgi:vancomycin resistance protein YoaR